MTTMAYRKIDLEGYSRPADMSAFQTAQGVGQRLEPALTALPMDLAATSSAISLRAIADELAAMRHLAEMRFAWDTRERWWQRRRDNATE